MPTPKLTKRRCEEVMGALERALAEGCFLDGLPSAYQRAGRILGLDHKSVRRAYARGTTEFGLMLDRPALVEPDPVIGDGIDPEQVRKMLLGKGWSIADLALKFDTTIGPVLDAIDTLEAKGVNVRRRGELFEIVRDAQPAFVESQALQIFSRDDNTFVFGVSGDQHIGSKYCRYDVLDDLYDRFSDRGVDCVFNTGNWIDGEARFNKYDLDVHGMDNQCRLMAERFPQRDGILTHAVWGDDHEGWYAQREGVDVGKYAEQVMRAAGREDWHDLGFMESHVELVNTNTGRTAILAVVHPGGGSAYATSYSVQKIVESYEGGEKPNVAFYGHYHKLWAGLIRNVWVLQSGTTQDQTIFMRKKRLEAHVGGVLVTLEQDPESGAIIGFEPKMIRYFNEEWYTREGRANSRWSYTRPAKMIPRSVGAV